MQRSNSFKIWARIVVLLVAILAISALFVASEPSVFAQPDPETCTEDPIRLTSSLWEEGADGFYHESTRTIRQCQYTFNGRYGEKISVLMVRNSTARSSDLDPYLEIKDAYGRSIVQNDDISSKNSNSWIDRYRLRKSGRYTIVARSYQDKTYDEFCLYLAKGDDALPYPTRCPSTNIN